MVGPAALGEVVVRAEVGVEAEVDFEIEIVTYLVFDGGGAAEVGCVALVQAQGSKIHLRLRPMDGRP